MRSSLQSLPSNLISCSKTSSYGTCFRASARSPFPALKARLFSSTAPRAVQALATKTILITGASRGIGAEIARRFAKEGGSCILIGRNEALLEGVKKELDVLGGGAAQEEGTEVRHRVIVGDVGSAEFWAGMRKEVSSLITISLGFERWSSDGDRRA